VPATGTSLRDRTPWGGKPLGASGDVARRRGAIVQVARLRKRPRQSCDPRAAPPSVGLAGQRPSLKSPTAPSLARPTRNPGTRKRLLRGAARRQVFRFTGFDRRNRQGKSVDRELVDKVLELVGHNYAQKISLCGYRAPSRRGSFWHERRLVGKTKWSSTFRPHWRLSD